MTPEEEALAFAIRWLYRTLLGVSVVSVPVEMLNGHPGAAVFFYALTIALAWRMR